MATFYAQPYSLDHTGFYFEDMDSFETGMDKLNAQSCKEVEIQFIDDDNHQAELAKAAEITQATINIWFETLEDLDEQDTL